MKIGAIIQARMGSTRLPGKVMLNLEGKTVLEHVIERVSQSTLLDSIIIATTTHPRDDVIENESLKYGVKVFRGSEEDVLSRYYYAAKENQIDVILRITSDCPLIDPKIIDDMVVEYLNNSFDLLSNGGLTDKQRTFPRGLDVAIFGFDVLEKAYKNANEKYQREHVTPFIYDNNKVSYYKSKINLSEYRWTLDTPEDLEMIRRIYSVLYRGQHNFYMKEILDLLEKEPELKYINLHIEQKKVKWLRR